MPAPQKAGTIRMRCLVCLHRLQTHALFLSFHTLYSGSSIMLLLRCAHKHNDVLRSLEVQQTNPEALLHAAHASLYRYKSNIVLNMVRYKLTCRLPCISASSPAKRSFQMTCGYPAEILPISPLPNNCKIKNIAGS